MKLGPRLKSFGPTCGLLLHKRYPLPDPFISNGEPAFIDINIGGKTAAETSVTIGAVREALVRLARMDDLQRRKSDPGNGDFFPLADVKLEPVDGQAVRD